MTTYGYIRTSRQRIAGEVQEAPAPARTALQGLQTALRAHLHARDPFLEPPAGPDVSVKLCLTARYTFMKQLPQRGSLPQIGVFHTHRLCNGWLCEVQVDNYTKLMP